MPEKREKTEAALLELAGLAPELVQLAKMAPMLVAALASFAETSEKIGRIEEDMLREREQRKEREEEREREWKKKERETDRKLEYLRGWCEKLEAQERRSNLIFHGIEESKEERTWEDTENLIRSVLKERNVFNEFQIERCHRL